MFTFFSCGYLDVSVPRVRLHESMDDGIAPAGLPHSDICGSKGICPSPQLFAAYHVLLRLREPRHPPYALSNSVIPFSPVARAVCHNTPCVRLAPVVLYLGLLARVSLSSSPDLTILRGTRFLLPVCQCTLLCGSRGRSHPSAGFLR